LVAETALVEGSEQRQQPAEGVAKAMKATLGTRLKQWLFLAATASGERRRGHCNVCDTKGVTFCSNAWVRAGVCSHCRSESRHRILAAALQYSDAFNYADLLYKKSVVHIAPEPALQIYASSATRRYIPGDLVPSRLGQKRIDLTRMPDFADASIDAIIAMDVFEHIPDEAAALRECHRVLNDGGYLIVSVPLPDHFRKTDEDKTIVKAAERTKFYGQYNHVRLYGEDIVDRIKPFGFDVAVVNAESFSPDIRTKHNLAPEGVLHPLATNHRRVIFASKRGLRA
jgi:SAM-dependent methyltransferase